jgi:hypothetical protein
VARLSKLQARVKDRLVLLPRIYTNKPRTTGIGYKGMAHQPDPNEDPNIVELPKLSKRPELRKFPVRDPAEGVRSIKAVRGSWCSMKNRQGRIGKIVIVVLFGQLQQQSGLSSTFFPGSG